MKKRFIAVSLVVAMAMTSLLACSSKNDAETASSDTKAKKEETKEEPTKVILNEVAHSIFYAPMYVAIEAGYLRMRGSTWICYRIWRRQDHDRSPFRQRRHRLHGI